MRPKSSPIRSWALLATFLAILAFARHMGVFVHLFEKDFYTEFTYPLEIDISLLVDRHLGNQSVADVEPINLFAYTYTKTSRLKCHELVGNVKLLLVVKSALGHFELRQAIRETWGNEQLDVIRRVFLLGSGPDEDIQRRIDQEDELYHDIVQSSFIDDYRQLIYSILV